MHCLKAEYDKSCPPESEIILTLYDCLNQLLGAHMTSLDLAHVTYPNILCEYPDLSYPALDPTCPPPPPPADQFAVQSCFRGRYGAETVTDQFGATVMIHAKYQNQHLVTGRIEYVEVTEAGQVSEVIP